MALPLDSWWHSRYVDGRWENSLEADSEPQQLIHNLRLRVRDLEAQLAKAESSAPAGSLNRPPAESDARLRTVVDSAPLLVWSSDPSQRRMWFNRPWLEFTGRTVEQELGFGWTEGVHPDDLARCLSTCRDAFEKREPFQLDYRLRRHDGAWHWVLDHGVPFFDKASFSGYVGSCIDITEHKQAEARHREREERIDLADISSGIGTWDWDLITNEVSWSPALYRVLGLSEDVRPSASAWGQLVHPDDKQRISEGLRKALQSESVLETEHRIIRPDGTTRWFSTLGRIFRDELGQPIRISGLNIDLTARKEGEQRSAFLLKLEDATRQLTEPHEITHTAAALLGEHLRVNRCAYAGVEEDQDTFNLTGDFTRGVPSIVGRYTFAQFGAECLRLMRVGEPYIVEDSETDERTQAVRDSYRQTFIRSVICVPLHKRGRFAAAMAVHAVTPRKWQANEVELLQVVANRCWESLERARAETELRSQWQTFDSLVSNVPDLMCTFDVEGRFTYANAALLQVWRKALADIIGKNTFELGYPLDLASRLQHEIRQVIRTAQSTRNHTPFTSANGETRTYEYILSPVYSGRGVVEAVTCAGRDVTDREVMERALAESQARFQQVFRQAPVAIAVFRGRELVIELANPSYEAMVQRANLVSRPLAEAVPDLGRHVFDAFHYVLETGDPFVANEWLIAFDQDGDGRPEDHWFNVVYHPLREIDGEISGVVAVSSEVTAQVTSRKELEKANRELEEFAYVASHDLQEPLRMVGIYTQVLLQRYLPDNPQAKEFASYIQGGVYRIEQLIQDLLSYSRTIHSDGAEIGLVDLNEPFRQAVSTMESRIQESGARVTTSTLPEVRGDVTQWVLVFQNLLSNSLKYRRPSVSPVIAASSEKIGANWILTLRDNGIGFEQQYAERIFMLFKRLHKDEYPGTGLGLAICQRVVERYGGRIWAEGRLGEGATFYISMPAPEEGPSFSDQNTLPSASLQV